VFELKTTYDRDLQGLLLVQAGVVFVSAITLLPPFWRGCEARARGQIYLHLLEPAVKEKSRFGILSSDLFPHLLAAQTAAGFVVELQRERNLVAALERTVADQTSELANLKRINEDQARELAVLRSSSASFWGLSSSASATRPVSAYFKR
jgi:hypothetical protein